MSHFSTRDLVSELISRSETVATAESLTAGLLAADIASVPGASAVLRGGLVVYATDLKASLAGVDDEILAQYGPVAAETAIELADGARDRCGSDWALSLTGVAGPDPQDGHQPGEVWCGVAGPHGSRAVLLPIEGQSREEIRHESASRAVQLLLHTLRGELPLDI
ncbi:CinA family protein [Corynebacterium sp. TAE3-ERU12]|uniref:CinA family protein n=1 Tax=Corynebacterium sp. TAE3-ERU12 TaxID=2849491 RepID=UPI001C4906DE|nr:CinA family protein [Corynebacterium sp. TAE3-ERU12]MBV7295270.1 CinA family protein [Corynebacterium sp. TAE3-ERU12]